MVIMKMVGTVVGLVDQKLIAKEDFCYIGKGSDALLQ